MNTEERRQQSLLDLNLKRSFTEQNELSDVNKNGVITVDVFHDVYPSSLRLQPSKNMFFLVFDYIKKNPAGVFDGRCREIGL